MASPSPTTSPEITRGSLAASPPSSVGDAASPPPSMGDAAAAGRGHVVGSPTVMASPSPTTSPESTRESLAAIPPPSMGDAAAGRGHIVDSPTVMASPPPTTSPESTRESVAATPPPSMVDAAAGRGHVVDSLRSAEDIFKDYRARRSAILRALTHDVEDFYAQCDPEKESLCLYGYANEAWEVAPPAQEVPTELPEPLLAINFWRDDMNCRDWLTIVAAYSDSWLLSVAFYYAARLNLDDRRRLFGMINELETVCEVVSGARQQSERSSMDNGGTAKPSVKIKNNGKAIDEAYSEVDSDHSEDLCATCGGIYSEYECWIGCDICERWYHGKCVKISLAMAESIKHYRCPSCSNNRARQ